MDKKLVIFGLAGILFVAVILPNHPTSSAPMKLKFMCDICETNFLHCMMKCHMEEYMHRHEYQNQIYMGKPIHKPRKNHLDMMFEHIMHSTGHES